MSAVASLGVPDSFETERLLVRAPREGDGPEVNAAILETWDALHNWMAWARTRPAVAESEGNARRARAAHLAGRELRWHLYLRESATLVGICGLDSIDWSVPKCMLGYWCRSRFEGSGYMTEAGAAVLRLAFETLAMRRVWLTCDTRNVRSRRLAERLGSLLEGTLRNDGVAPDGRPRDTFLYAMTPEDYGSRRMTGDG